MMSMQLFRVLSFVTALLALVDMASGQHLEGVPFIKKGQLVYSNAMSVADSMADWKMEGQGALDFADGWMVMSSPNEAGHHVLWCPKDLPSSFVAEWEVQNRHAEAGLCIVFFATKGKNGEDILNGPLRARNGKFTQYTKGDMHNYHISYHANTPTQPNRPFAHLRKNSGFHKVHVGGQGIVPESKAIHKLRLVKDGGRILFFLDGRCIIDWTDDGQAYGAMLNEGKLGFRQMKWTRFAYRDFKVWELDGAVVWP